MYILCVSIYIGMLLDYKKNYKIRFDYAMLSEISTSSKQKNTVRADSLINLSILNL